MLEELWGFMGLRHESGLGFGIVVMIGKQPYSPRQSCSLSLLHLTNSIHYQTTGNVLLCRGFAACIFVFLTGTCH